MREKKKEVEQETYENEKKYLGNVTEKSLYVAGLMLYLSEGAKKKDSQLVLANTDPVIIRFFLKWCEKFLSINKEESRVQLHLYENMNIEKECKFWQNALGIHSGQFYKPSIRELKKGSFTYQATHGHGTCSLYVPGVKRVRKVMQGIRAFMDISMRP